MSKQITNQAKNELTIVGKLLDVNFNRGTSNDGRVYERANMTIRVTQPINGKEEVSEVPVTVFVNQLTRDGQQSAAWDNFQRNKAEMRSVAGAGAENASTIRMNRASIRENNFVSRTGNMVSGWQIGAPYFDVGASAKEIAGFRNEIFVMDMREEMDRDGELTGRLIVKGALVQYGGKLDVLEYIVEDPEGVEYITSNWQNNQTVVVEGRIRYGSKEEEVLTESSGWGEQLPTTSTRTVRELIITRASEPVDEDIAYDATEIRKAFNVRKANIEQLQVNAKKKVAAPAAPKAAAPAKYDWE